MKKRYYFLLITLTLIIGYIIFEVIHLKLYIINQPLNVEELTKEEKKEDFEFLTNLIEEVYPYSELLYEVKGLNNIKEFKHEFILKAQETKDNKEFLALFLSYLESLRQAGHGGIQLNKDYNFYTAFSFNIPKDSFLKTKYWQELISQLNYYVHSELQVVYAEGKYILSQAYSKEDVILPIDSAIVSIDGMPIDNYVLRLQYYQPLLYDTHLKKVFATDLFKSNINKNSTVWMVEFLTPNKTKIKVPVNKLLGYVSNHNQTQPATNLLTREIDANTAYIHINSFESTFIKEDGNKLREFFSHAGGKYRKLIIDLRGNSGGEITYWINNLVRPFIKESKSYTVKTAIRKQFKSIMGEHLLYYRLATTNDLLDTKFNPITKIDKKKTKDWIEYSITKTFQPSNTYQFDGEIYILVNQDTLSAADSFVSAAKELKLATVVGTNTLGWGNHYMQPVLFSLPNSGLMFQMDVELAYNADDRVSSIYGTMPDIYIEPSTYPTSLPVTYEVPDLLKDKVISYILR